jgi:hypothetical protein
MAYIEDHPHCRECDCPNCVYFLHNNGNCQEGCLTCKGDTHVEGCYSFDVIEED